VAIDERDKAQMAHYNASAERDAARAEVLRLTAQVDQLRKDFDRANAWGGDLFVELAASEAEVLRLRGALERLAATVCTTCRRDADARRALGTASPGLPKPMDEGRDSSNKNLLDQAVPPSSGTPAKCGTCGGARKLDDGPDFPPSDCPDCTPTPSLPKESGWCANWCGRWAGELPDDGVHWNSHGQGFCSEDCRDAGRSLHPAPGTAKGGGESTGEAT
jgi:hypothetical protein